MSRLVPFPDEVGSFEDADLLDLNVSVALSDRNAETAEVEAWARYATGARTTQVSEFYRSELMRCGALVDVPRPGEQPEGHLVSATLNDERKTRFHVMVDHANGYRAVKVIVKYDRYDHHTLFAQFADWHSGTAPVSSGFEPTGVEISTFANGRSPNPLVLYSTNYGCDETPRSVRRAMVDSRLDELGLTYREPREGIMFIQDGHFDAETHVVGDDRSSSVTFVGEFQLR